MDAAVDTLSSRGASGERGRSEPSGELSAGSLPLTGEADSSASSRDSRDDPEDGRLLNDDDGAEDHAGLLPPSPLPAALAGRLYVSHFLSTWNSRMFEFAAVLFLAAAYPDTLRPVSVYAVARGLAAVVFAEAVGAAIDRGDRLAVVRASIVGGRLAVVGSCVLWLMGGHLKEPFSSLSSLSSFSSFSSLSSFSLSSSSPASSGAAYSLVVVLACVEKLCAVMNLVAVERDWVVVLTADDEPARGLLNARMRRIDLFCKLAGPLAIALVAAVSVHAAIAVTLAVNAVSVSVEYRCIAVLYHRIPGLRRHPAAADTNADSASDNASTASFPASSLSPSSPPSSSPTQAALAALRAGLRQLLPLSSLPFYVRHPAVLPSLSLAVLYLTVLSLSGQMVTYLLSAGCTAATVGLVRTASTALELAATWVAPQLVARIGSVRAGMWSLSWQSIWLTAGAAWFFACGAGAGGSTGGNGRLAATGLVLGVAVSRVGLWSFDLCAQAIVQDEVDEDHRGAFSTAEAAFQNLFEVLSYVVTMVFARPDQFRWPVAVSIAAVYAAAALYAAFVRRRRGHLFHSPLPPAQRWIDKTFFSHTHELASR